MENILTREEMKHIAKNNMKKLDIYRPYITEFMQNDTVTMFERFGGYYATAWNNMPDEEEIVKHFESTTGHLVYAMTHDYTNFGEMYTLLIVSKYAEDQSDVDEDKCTFCYVVNKDEPMFSEYGTCQFQSFGGGIKRIA